MKGISILGSTGSIGCNTLKVIDHLGEFRVVALAAGRNMPKLAAQIAACRPEMVSCDDHACAELLREELRKLSMEAPQIMTGEEGLIAAATHSDARHCGVRRGGSRRFCPDASRRRSGQTHCSCK